MTIPQLKEACNLLSPNMVFFCETKTRKQFMEKVQRKLRFEECVVVESMNKSGGMAILWNPEVKGLEVKTTAFTMEIHIMDTEHDVDW